MAKVKSPAQTAALGKGHKYLGHFRKAKYLNDGHNTDGKMDWNIRTPDNKVIPAEGTVYSDSHPNLNTDIGRKTDIKQRGRVDDIDPGMSKNPDEVRKPKTRKM